MAWDPERVQTVADEPAECSWCGGTILETETYLDTDHGQFCTGACADKWEDEAEYEAKRGA